MKVLIGFAVGVLLGWIFGPVPAGYVSPAAAVAASPGAFSLSPVQPLITRENGLTQGAAPEDWQPPAKFQGGALTAVYWATPAELARQCAGPNTGGCEVEEAGKRPLIVVPNPCLYADGDSYARRLCHELGHANGWPSDHAGGHWDDALPVVLKGER